MAIRRQRHRREEAVRAKARRSSHQSDNLMLSDSGGSQISLDGKVRSSIRHQKMMGGVTTFHVGVVFLFMGLLLLISGLVPGYANNNRQYWEDPSMAAGTGTSTNTNSDVGGNSSSDDRKINNNRRAPLLLGTGSFLILAGTLLIIAHRVASRKEEEQFSRYISRKLAPPKIVHQPASLSQLHQPRNSREDSISSIHAETDQAKAAASTIPPANGDANPPCQSPTQLESILEEAEGSERASTKDKIYWTSDVAPVHQQHQSNSKHREHHHHHHHHRHPHHESSTG